MPNFPGFTPPTVGPRSSLLQAFFSVRSERQPMEQLDYNLMFRWFVGLGVDEPVWDATVFTKNRGGSHACATASRSQ
jgi:transposase